MRVKTMKHDVICGWLGLPSTSWPPDHYALLGLQRGEENVERIEQSVHERLARLRCYQITNPEQATEAMNRLAQAFMCLTDPTAKRCYDAGLTGRTDVGGGERPPAPAKQAGPATTLSAVLPPRAARVTAPAPTPPRPAALPAKLLDTMNGSTVVTHVDWQATPPPVRSAVIVSTEGPPQGPVEAPAGSVPPVRVALEALPAPVPQPQTVAAAPTAPNAAAMDSWVGAAPSGPLAGYKGFSRGLLCRLTSRHGLGTRQALYRRVRQTRRLLYAWERAGKYLGKAKRQLKRPEDERELSRALAAIARHLKGFPRMLGHPGQPGYRVAARARLPLVAEQFNALDVEHRELLARDWAAGQTLLSSHRQFLRQELRSVRGLTRWGWGFRVAVNDFPLKPLLWLTAIAAVLIGFLAIVL
jgi:hypothetical protein